MAVHQLISSLRQELFEKPDDVVNGWFMSNNPALIVGILSTYWMFVYKIGPNWMRDRKPYDPKALLQLYNIIQVVVCLGMVIWVSSTLESIVTFYRFITFGGRGRGGGGLTLCQFTAVYRCGHPEECLLLWLLQLPHQGI